MSIGLSSKFSILHRSPHDEGCQTSESNGADPLMGRWSPSRYTVRATTNDGRLILWNTLRGSMSVFEREQRATVESLLKRKGFEGRLEGAAKYLQERGFIIDQETNEYRQFQLAFGRQHYRQDTLQLILLASEDCNFRCEYCYEDFSRGTMKPEVRAGIKALVGRRMHGMRSLSVSWFGGEPLYGWPAIEELGPFFAKTAEENDIQYRSNMTTNAFLLTPEVAEKLLEWKVRRYQITIDGPPEFHNRSRPTRTGKGTFDTIVENLESLGRRDDSFTVDIRVNFDRKNSPHMSDLFDRIEQGLGNDERFRFRFRAVGRWGGKNDKNLDVCGGKEEVADVKWRLKEEARKRGLNISDGLREVKGVGAVACYAARPYNFIIGATGKVMKCTIDLDLKDRNVVGHLAEDGELEIDADKFALWTEPAFESDKKCQKCVVLPACEGLHCPQVRMDYNKSPCTPLRMNYKKEMQQLMAVQGTAARKVKVDRNGAAEAAVAE